MLEINYLKEITFCDKNFMWSNFRRFCVFIGESVKRYLDKIVCFSYLQKIIYIRFLTKSLFSMISLVIRIWIIVLRKTTGMIITFSWYGHCIKKRIFVLRKFVKRRENIIFSVVSVFFRFTEISYFLNFPSNENVRKQHLSSNTYSSVNVKFSHKIAGRKDDFSLVFRSTFRWRYLSENMKFSVLLQRKQAIFWLFIKDVYVFPISCRKHDRRIEDLFFLSFVVLNAYSL